MTSEVITNVVRERLGLDPATLGERALERTVEARMAARGLTDPAMYAVQLITDAVERDALACDLSVPESWFFRGGRSLFERLAAFIADRTDSSAIGTTARILSVPCSGGEEPYSLAIALYERFLTPDDFRIDAVDLSERALAKAATARYGNFAFRETDSDLRPAYFRPVSDAWELLPRIREMVHFQRGNLTDSNFLANERLYDLIICRNLFIYLTAEARVRAMANIDRLLTSGGRLCVTPAEADRLPPGRFSLDGATELGIYRRIGSGSDIREAPKKTSVSPPVATPPPFVARPRPTAAANVAVRQSSPITPPPLRMLDSARLLADAGRLEEAQAVCEQLLRTSVSDVDAISLLGVIHLAAARENDAFDAFRKALYLKPDHTEAMSHMIGLCERRGDKARAAALRRRLAQLTNDTKKEGA